MLLEWVEFKNNIKKNCEEGRKNTRKERIKQTKDDEGFKKGRNKGQKARKNRDHKVIRYLTMKKERKEKNEVQK